MVLVGSGFRIQPIFETDPDPGKLYGFHGSGSATLLMALLFENVFNFCNLLIGTGYLPTYFLGMHRIGIGTDLAGYPANPSNGDPLPAILLFFFTKKWKTIFYI